MIKNHCLRVTISYGWISLSKTSVCLEKYDLLYVYIDTKYDDKEFMQFKQWKN